MKILKKYFWKIKHRLHVWLYFTPSWYGKPYQRYIHWSYWKVINKLIRDIGPMREGYGVSIDDIVASEPHMSKPSSLLFNYKYNDKK